MFFEYHFHGCIGHKTIELNRTAYEEMSVFLKEQGGTDAFLATFSAAPVDHLVEGLEIRIHYDLSLNVGLMISASISSALGAS